MIAALEECFGKGSVEVDQSNSLALYGYMGDDRSRLSSNNPNYAPKCAIRIARKYVGASSNDIGFYRTEDGGYKAYVSDYDQGGTFTKRKQKAVQQSYTIKVTSKQLKAQGYLVKLKKLKNGSVQVTGSRYK